MGLWYWVQFLFGFGPCRIMTWWEDDDFIVEFGCMHTLEVWARYRCTVKEQAEPPTPYFSEDDDEYGDEEGGFEEVDGWDN